MATIATLTYNAYLRLIFDTYNERYEGSYPNLRYVADVRFKFQGNFSIQANNTIKLGGLTWTGYMNYGYPTTDSGWIGLGTINENMGCSRQRSWSWGCSCSGWPNLSGTASVTSPQIGLPTYSASISDVSITSLKINASFSNNPYGLYTIRVYDSTKGAFINNNLSGSMTVSGLTEKTTYSYDVEAFMADCSGLYLQQKTVSATTLESYDIPTITSVDVTVTPTSETTDNFSFTVHTSDDTHVQSNHILVDAVQHTVTGLTNYVNAAGNNRSYTATFYITDKLSRTSGTYSITFDATFTYMEVWTCVENGEMTEAGPVVYREWERGYSMALNSTKHQYKLCKLYVFNGTKWVEAIKYT